MTLSSDTSVTTTSRSLAWERDMAMTGRAGVTAWRQIADALAEEIAAGEPPAGAQLPTEAQLASRFRVNRHTVRRSLSELAARGLVRAAQGRGTFVEERPLPYRIGPRTRFSEIVSRQGREAAGVLLEAVIVKAEPRVLAALHLPDGASVLRFDTLRSADGAPISMGRAFFPVPRFADLADRYRAFGALTPALEACGVAEYRRAETHVTARIATAEQAARLDLAPNRPVLAVDSLNVDAESTPIQFTFAVFAADRCDLVFES